jgi:ADP-ribose pyrophosphatase YjhB (NUDIX family)
MAGPNAFCGWCGEAFDAASPWPRTCAGCDNTTWRNPTPVGVMIVPVDDGVLLIRRGIEPCVGQLALPGGYLVTGETWQEGAARELWEETGLRVDPAEVREFAVRSPPHGRVLLVFGVCAPRVRADLPPFAPTDETTEMVVTEAPVPLAFPTHTEVLSAWFAARQPAGS